MGQKNNAVFFDSTSAPEYPAIEQGLSLDKQTILLRLTASGTDFRRTVKVDEIADEALELDAEMVKVTKVLIHPKFYAAISAYDSAVRTQVYSLGFRPSFIGTGVVLLPLTLVVQANELLEGYIRNRQAAVETLIGKYEQAKEQARQANPHLYNEAEYPSVDEIRRKFSVSYRFFTASVPDAISEIDNQIFQKQREAADKEWEGAVAEVRDALRASFAELVLSMSDKVSGMQAEKKVFKQGFVDNFKLFLETFEARNLTNDAELQALVGKASELLDGVNPDMLRKDIEVRTIVESGLDQIKQSLSRMTVTKGRLIKL
jgi:F0F1-type ATP synthase membrane subunit b/b'